MQDLVAGAVARSARLGTRCALRRARARSASGASATSTGVSSSAKTRSPPASADCVSEYSDESWLTALKNCRA